MAKSYWNIIIFSIYCLTVSFPIHISAQDYKGAWNTPTFNLSYNDFKYVYFGKKDPWDRTPGIEPNSIPPIPGIKYRTCYNLCPKDTCYATRTVLAVRCPENKILLKWASQRVAWLIDSGGNESFKKPETYDVPGLSSSAEICNYYISQAKKDNIVQECLGAEDSGSPNEQYGYLLTDCWETPLYCTFYVATWYDWLSCGDNTRESYISVNKTTGKVAQLEDLIKSESLPKLEKLLFKYLKNYNGELWVDCRTNIKDIKPSDILNDRNGCALIKEGLVIYYYPYNIGSGAEGQFNAIIPYKELAGILLER